MTDQEEGRRRLRLAVPPEGAPAPPPEAQLWQRWGYLAKVGLFIAALAIGYTEMRLTLKSTREDLAAEVRAREKALGEKADQIAVLRRELKTAERAIAELEKSGAAVAGELINRRQAEGRLRDDMRARDSELQRQLDRIIDWYHGRESSAYIPGDGE